MRNRRVSKGWLLHRWAGMVAGLALGGLLGGPAGGAARGAETLVIAYGPLERSIAIDDLATFAQNGTLTPQLHRYARTFGFGPAELEQYRQYLQEPFEDLEPLALSQLLYTAQGERLLQELVRVVQTSSGAGSVEAMRGALITAAFDLPPVSPTSVSPHSSSPPFSGDGLTLLNVLRHYPTDTLRVDLGQGLALFAALERAVIQSAAVVSWVEGISQIEAADSPPLDVAQVRQQLQAAQIYGIDRRTLPVATLENPVDLYLPRPRRWQTPPTAGFPLVVISHGLGSDQETYAYLAKTLAKAGIAVATLDHTGSNGDQLTALLAGRADTVVDNQEFTRRPQEVSATLDALERLTAAPPLNLEQVGVIGQSFGGYTALALAGATFDRAYLDQACNDPGLSFNLSLLLQCQALALGEGISPLVDERVGAIFIMNPIGSALFGPQGYGQVEVPVFVVAGAADTVAPALPEQITPFTWLQTSQRYLLVVGAGTHFSVVGDVGKPEDPISIPPFLIGPNPQQVQGYMEVLTLAFFRYTLGQDRQFEAVLQAGFVRALGQLPHPLSPTQTFSAEDLEEALNSPLPANTANISP